MEEEEKKYKDIELRSEEVQEVMNHISPWVVRCGITVAVSYTHLTLPTTPYV